MLMPVVEDDRYYGLTWMKTTYMSTEGARMITVDRRRRPGK